MSKKRDRKSPVPADAGAPAQSERLAGRALDVWRAGLGALQATRRRGGAEFDALVARGTEARGIASETVDAALDRVRATLGSLADSPRDVAAWAAGTVADALEGAVEAALDAAGVARRDDVQRLRADLRALDTRLARLAGADPPPLVTFHVRPHGRAWAVEGAGRPEPIAILETKKLALAEGRRLARAIAPSRLVVHDREGTTSDDRTYEG